MFVTATAALIVAAHFIQRRRRATRWLLFPSASAIATAAAKGWPHSAIEPFSSLLTLAGCGDAVKSGVPASRVRVTFSTDNDRKSHGADSEIDAVWNRRLAAAKESGGRLFDQSKFRLAKIGWAPGGREEVVQIDLGLTSYKEYVGTNQRPDAQRGPLEADGLRTHGDASAHLSNALGCDAAPNLRRSDRLLRRSGELRAGAYNGPSGHAEPSNIGVDCAW